LRAGSTTVARSSEVGLEIIVVSVTKGVQFAMFSGLIAREVKASYMPNGLGSRMESRL